MNKLHSIHIYDGDEVVLVFGEERVLEVPDHVANKRVILLEALDGIVNDPAMTEESKEKLLNMTVADFCTTIRNAVDLIADEPAAKSVGAPKMDVIRHPEKYTCPYCGIKDALRVVDGELMCPCCGIVIGDIDELPEFI